MSTQEVSPVDQQATIDALKAEVERLSAVCAALEDACMTAWVVFDPSKPRGTVNALIDWHVKVALDPEVSSDAQELINRGRLQACGGEQKRAMFDRIVSLETSHRAYLEKLRERDQARESQIRRLLPVLSEGVNGFSMVLVQTSDDKAVRGWQARGRQLLDSIKQERENEELFSLYPPL